MAKKQKKNKKEQKTEKLSGTKAAVETVIESETKVAEVAETEVKQEEIEDKAVTEKAEESANVSEGKPKPKVNHFVFVTTDDEDAEVNRYQVRPWLLWLVIIVLILLIGSMLGYISHEEKIWRAVDARSDEQVATIKSLEESNAILEQEKLALETEIVGLNETVQILSETVSQKTQSEKELREQIEKQSLPTEFPLNGSATMDEKTIDDAPICVFDASIGSAVVATASGKVTAVKDDAEYVHSIWVDHGNGYITIYRNAGEPRVQVGDSVVCGTALYIIEERKEEMGYQMMLDNQYINPMDLLSING
ncbi:MAG: M23 family metallopeptidase [Lachnospiraceae bacterium]|nr:M23 family metallopeptidase [Lachnospiraceae bacterium]